MRIYLGIFLIAFSMLAVEVALLRLLSAISWYHLAFFAISTAMLGMTAGATTVYLRPRWFTESRVRISLARACFAYSLATPLALLLLCITPLGMTKSIVSLFALVVATAVCSLPFYFSGIAITAVLTKIKLPIGRLYASDLIGASLGCLFVLAGLEVFDAPSFIILGGAVGVLAALAFAWRELSARTRTLGGTVFLLLVIVALVNSASPFGIRPLVVKERFDNPASHLLEKWNTFSRVVVRKGAEVPPYYWGPSPLAPMTPIYQYEMQIDGDAGTSVRPFVTFADLDHLRFDATNIAYHIRSEGGACIIGVGGGRDVQSALLFGHQRVTGVEVNPILIGLLQNEFRDFAGIADHEAVTLVVDDARSYLARSDETFSIVQMSMIDTWAATGAGAFSLSENALYTVEAWQIMLDRLAEDGILTVSRWHSPGDLGETGRLVSLALASLLESGIQEPSRHLAMIASDKIATLLTCKRPLSDSDIAGLTAAATRLRFDVVFLPGTPPQNDALRKILAAGSLEELDRAVADEPLNYHPPTDEDPHFFNMLRLDNLRPIIASSPGVARGNLLASLTLGGLIFSLLVLSVVTIVVPLLKGASRHGGGADILWPGAVYFSLLGAGFMFVEIGLIQRLSVFLGHPVYALAILLFTIILSAGLGSLLSDCLPMNRAPWLYIFPVITVLLIIGTRFWLVGIMAGMATADIPARVIASIASIFPLGLLLGMFFPTGMRLVQSTRSSETPWYWALNGIFGVLSSALAVAVSIYAGISMNFYIGAVCYALSLLCLSLMARAADTRPVAITD